jgi:hypothetical protein
MGVQPDQPPHTWNDIDPLQLTPLITYAWTDGEELPTFWHWCLQADGGRWVAADTADHTLVSREPLTVEPSLAWPCCGLNGNVRDGRWTPA